MKRALWIIAGVVLMMSALWGGGYALGMSSYQDWFSFPAFITAFLGFCAGAVCLVKGTEP